MVRKEIKSRAEKTNPIDKATAKEIEADPKKYVKTQEDFFKALSKILTD
jgi:hypothetical protein